MSCIIKTGNPSLGQQARCHAGKEAQSQAWPGIAPPPAECNRTGTEPADQSWNCDRHGLRQPV